MSLKLKNNNVVLRDYQKTIVNNITSNILNGKPMVLGAAPASGKTIMSVITIIDLINSGKISSVLILTHGTTVLRTNFVDELVNHIDKSEIGGYDDKKRINPTAPIQVMLPQNIRNIDREYDLVITDEAHHFVLGDENLYTKSHQEILDITKPKGRLYLTGTPSKFNLKNNKEKVFDVMAIGRDIIGSEFFHSVTLDLVMSSYNFSSSDYNEYSELKTDVDIKFNATSETMNNVILAVVKNVFNRSGITVPNDTNLVLEGKKMVSNKTFGKTLIVCKRIEQAQDVKRIIKKALGGRVSISTSSTTNGEDADTSSKKIQLFKESKLDFLIVVGRAKEGYDDPTMRNLIDLSMTHNVDTIYQILNRVTRLDVTNTDPKMYIKVTSMNNGYPQYTRDILSASIMLGKTSNILKFDGKNFRGIEIPKFKNDVNKDELLESNIDGNGTTIDMELETVDGDYDGENYGDDSETMGSDEENFKYKKINSILSLDLIDAFTDDDYDLNGQNKRYATTTLGNPDRATKLYDVSNINECVVLGKKYGIISEGQWCGKSTTSGLSYKDIQEIEGLILPSMPSDTFELGVGGSGLFSEMLGGGRNVDVNLAQCVELSKKYGILSSVHWARGTRTGGLSYKDIQEIEGLRLPSKPGLKFNLKGGGREFTKLIEPQKKGYDVKTMDEVVVLCKKYGVTTIGQWRGSGHWTKGNIKKGVYSHREIMIAENKKLPSKPWSTLNFDVDVFSELIKDNEPKYTVNTLEEVIVLCKKYNIMTSEQYIGGENSTGNSYKDIQEMEGERLPYKPLIEFNLKGGGREFTNLLRG